MFYLFYDYWYIVVIIITMLIGGAASAWVKKQLNTYSQVPASRYLTGRQAAEMMLSDNNVYGVTLKPGGPDQDYFNPLNNSITLDSNAYNTSSITSISTAFHECGHACQNADGYWPIKVRGALVPVVNFVSNAWLVVLILGFIFHFSGLIWGAIIAYGATLVFQLITLPVEFNASNRAIKYMESAGFTQEDVDGSKKVLKACAMTYVAAALASAIQLLYWIGRAKDN